MRVGEVVEVLEDLGVPERQAQVQRRHRRHDSAHVVRGHHDRVDLGRRSDLFSLEDSTGLRDVGLQNIDGPAAPDFAKLGRAIQAFTGGYRQRCVLPDRLQGRNVAGPCWLLDPADVVLLDMAGDLAGLRGGEPAVHLDHYLRAGARHGSNCLDQVERPVELGALELHVAVAERVEFHSPVAAVNHFPGGLCELLGRAFDRVPAVCVGRNFLLHLAAKQLENRLSALLSDDVPEGEFDQCDARIDHLARLAEVEKGHATVQGLDIERVVTDEVAFDVLQVLDNGVGLAEHAGFTDADDPLVGLDDAVGQVSPGRAQHQGSESGGLHARLAGGWFKARKYRR